jgi:hypothetical protein
MSTSGDVGEGPRQSGRGRGLLGAGQAGVGDTDDLEALGQGAQRRDMGMGRPTPARLQTDDANPEALSNHEVLSTFMSLAGKGNPLSPFWKGSPGSRGNRTGASVRA